ncbi:hypothetical protein KAI87_01275 [Myxococcota bacterium]|nr:hypothetical protein [Myxococcota bacterium]
MKTSQRANYLSLALIITLPLFAGCAEEPVWDNPYDRLGDNFISCNDSSDGCFKMSAGGESTCIIDAANDLYCWGSIRQTAGDNPFELSPVRPTFTDSKNWLEVSVGADHICAIDNAQNLGCWGINGYGQIGTGVTSTYESFYDILVPAGAAQDIRWTSVSASLYRSCGLTTQGDIFCWGNNLSSQCAQPTGDDVFSPALVERDGTDWFQVLGSAYDATCAVQAGDLKCWGANRSGECGTGETDVDVIYSEPENAAFSESLQSISGGGWHFCALDYNSKLLCWGYNSSGQLGNGQTASLLTPAYIEEWRSWETVEAGDAHTCAIESDGSLWCWGNNEFGQLGNDSIISSNIPIHIGSDTDWTNLALGESHTCASKMDQSIYCWGRNHTGQLGVGDTDDRRIPRLVIF